MPLQKKVVKLVLTGSLRRVIAWRLLLMASLSVICLALAFPVRVSAHTDLLRTAPTKDAILYTAPGQVRLWFSAAVSPEYSTAFVVNGAHEYVNARDAFLPPRDAREMVVPLPPRLPAGVYTVVWRADSDSDGFILSGAYSFAIVQPGRMVPDRNIDFAGPNSSQFDSLVQTLLLFLILIAECFQLLDLLLVATPANTGQSLTRRQLVYMDLEEEGAVFCKKEPGVCYTRAARRASIMSIVGLFCLSLGLVYSAAGIFSPTRTAPMPILSLRQGTESALSAFHAEVRTTDKQLMIELDINTDRCCGSRFAVGVRDASTGKPVANVRVVLFTTMLDMSMGTDAVKVRSDGKGGFSAQSDLSMGGLWQICVGIGAIHHTLHEACVKVLISY